MIHIHVNHKTPLLLRQNPEWRLCQPPLAPTVAIPVASLPGSSWVVSPVSFPSLPPSVWFVCLVSGCGLFVPFLVCAFSFLGRPPWVGAGGEGLRRFRKCLRRSRHLPTSPVHGVSHKNHFQSQHCPSAGKRAQGWFMDYKCASSN